MTQLLEKNAIVYIVYKTTNTTNRKYYIGKHKQRGLDFDGYLGSGKVLLESIRKHGKDNFIRETLEICKTDNDCYVQEEKHLCEHLHDSNCYNLVPGGRGTGSGKDHPLYGKTRSEETKRKISEANTGNIVSEERKNRISQSMKQTIKNMSPEERSERAIKSMNAPETYTEERSGKISKALTGIVRSEKTKKQMSETTLKQMENLGTDVRKDIYGSSVKGKTWKLVNGKRVWMNREEDV